MTSVQLEVLSEEHSSHKWRVPLKEDVFAAFMAKGGPIVHKNPCVDWFQTDACYILKSELPELGNSNIHVSVENGNVIEISGLWKHKQEARTTTDWRTGKWWEHGFVRRLELPENTDWKKIEAYVNNDTLLDIRLPKNSLKRDITRGNEGVIKDSASTSI
ncbi:21.7 kDa class VI heat shock protein isoform X2 [Rutidosis leptorrhynchoides]|uniref:21.7 kDa class VI heat shock protein isoform X2 n=1 Tax=Rutidosis leptorrhynchoides TaxID=125765 RepID=UPI003A9A4861